MSTVPLVTVAVPSYNQGRFLDDALESIFQQDLPIEVFVADGGSKDSSVEVIKKWQSKLAGWRSQPDKGQGHAINECIAKGSAPYVCWLNSDDIFLPGGLSTLVETLEKESKAPAAYGRTWNLIERTGKRRPVWVEPFDEHRLAQRCIISQPGTLIRRAAWEALGGADPSFDMTMDYDLWWRLYKAFGPLVFVDTYVAINRDHGGTKTRNKRRQHYVEAMRVVRTHYGRVPIKWWLAQPYAVWFKAMTRMIR